MPWIMSRILHVLDHGYLESVMDHMSWIMSESWTSCLPIPHQINERREHLGCAPEALLVAPLPSLVKKHCVD